MKISNLTSSVYYVTLPKREVSIGFPLAITRIILMNIVLNLKENPSLSQKEREKILALLQNQVAGDINLSISDETQEEVGESTFILTLSKELLLNNLTALQNDALELEEQITHLKERNNYLEEKVNWLRNKAGGGSFIPSKVKSGANHSLGDSTLQTALVEVINTMESTALEKARLSFSKSKRARKDKALGISILLVTVRFSSSTIPPI